MKTLKLKKFFEKFGGAIYPLAGFGLILLAWFIAAKIIGITIILPSPALAFKEFFSLLSQKEAWTAVGMTLYRSLYSFALAFISAAVFAVAGYLFKPLHKIISPIVSVLRSLPTMSIILIAIIWFSSAKSPVFIAFLITFPMLYANFYGALEGLDPALIKMSNLYAVPLKTQISELYIPGVLPSVFVASRSSVSLNVKVIIAAEVLAQTKDSIGRAMQVSRVFLDTATLMGWTILAVLLSYLLELVVYFIEKSVVRWKR